MQGAGAVIFASSASKKGGNAEKVSFPSPRYRQCLYICMYIDAFIQADRQIDILWPIVSERRRKQKLKEAHAQQPRASSLVAYSSSTRWRFRCLSACKMHEEDIHASLDCKCLQVDCIGVENVAKACIAANVERLVVISSCAVTRPDSLGYKFTNILGAYMHA